MDASVRRRIVAEAISGSIMTSKLSIRVARQALAVVVLLVEQHGEDTATIRTGPRELGGPAWRAVTAAESGRVHAKTPGSLRTLRHVAELVGHSADRHRVNPERLMAMCAPDEQVAHGSLAAGEELLVLQTPRADRDAVVADVRAEAPALVGRISR